MVEIVSYNATGNFGTNSLKYPITYPVINQNISFPPACDQFFGITIK